MQPKPELTITIPPLPAPSPASSPLFTPISPSPSPSPTHIQSHAHLLPSVKPPPSPTSSLKACFVRSRPTSTTFSDYDCPFSDFSLLGLGDLVRVPSISSGTASPPTSASHASEEDDFMDRVTQATEQWARAQALEREADGPLRSANSDARSMALSTLTAGSRCTVVPVRIVRRSDAAPAAAAVAVEQGQKEAKGMGKWMGRVKVKAGEEAQRRRTWPTYQAIRKSVSNIVHRKEAMVGPVPGPGAIPAPPPSPTAAEESAAKAPSEPLKSSAASLFTRRRRVTVSDAAQTHDQADRKSTRTMAFSRPKFLLQRALSTSSRPHGGLALPATALQHRAPIRRSRSFSGFTDVLSAIGDGESERDEDMDELDEVTAEARGVVEDIGRRWAFEEVMEDEREENDGFLFERCVQ